MGTLREAIGGIRERLFPVTGGEKHQLPNRVEECIPFRAPRASWQGPVGDWTPPNPPPSQKETDAHLMEWARGLRERAVETVKREKEKRRNEGYRRAQSLLSIAWREGSARSLYGRGLQKYVIRRLKDGRKGAPPWVAGEISRLIRAVKQGKERSPFPEVFAMERRFLSLGELASGGTSLPVREWSEFRDLARILETRGRDWAMGWYEKCWGEAHPNNLRCPLIMEATVDVGLGGHLSVTRVAVCDPVNREKATIRFNRGGVPLSLDGTWRKITDGWRVNVGGRLVEILRHGVWRIKSALGWESRGQIPVLNQGGATVRQLGLLVPSTVMGV